MRQFKTVLALLLAAALVGLAGCRGTVGPEGPSASPVPPVSAGPEKSAGPEESTGQEESVRPEESLPPEDAPAVPDAGEEGQPEDEAATLTVDGQELDAVRHYSPLGYSIVYPEDQITLNAWEDGDNYLVSEARGTYLAVSQVAASNISGAASIVQFEHAVEDEPKGFMFGSEGYAGVRMVEEAGGLTLEFILVEQDGAIFLLERAIFTGGEEAAPLLDAMLDTFTIQ